MKDIRKVKLFIRFLRQYDLKYIPSIIKEMPNYNILFHNYWVRYYVRCMHSNAHMFTQQEKSIYDLLWMKYIISCNEPQLQDLNHVNDDLNSYLEMYSGNDSFPIKNKEILSKINTSEDIQKLLGKL